MKRGRLRREIVCEVMSQEVKAYAYYHTCSNMYILLM